MSRPKTESKLLEFGAPFPIAVIADKRLRGRIHEWGRGHDEIRSVGLSYPRLDCEVYTYGYVLWGGPVPTWRDLSEMLLSKLAFASGAVRQAMGTQTSGGDGGEEQSPASVPGSDFDQAIDAVMENFRSRVKSQAAAVAVDGLVQEGLTVATPGFWMTGLGYDTTGLGYDTTESRLTIVLGGRGDPKPVALTLVDRLSPYTEPA